MRCSRLLLLGNEESLAALGSCWVRPVVMLLLMMRAKVKATMARSIFFAAEKSPLGSIGEQMRQKWPCHSNSCVLRLLLTPNHTPTPPTCRLTMIMQSSFFRSSSRAAAAALVVLLSVRPPPHQRKGERAKLMLLQMGSEPYPDDEGRQQSQEAIASSSYGGVNAIKARCTSAVVHVSQWRLRFLPVFSRTPQKDAKQHF